MLHALASLRCCYFTGADYDDGDDDKDHDNDDDDYGDDVLLNGVKDDNAGIGRKAIAALDSAKVIITHRKH